MSRGIQYEKIGDLIHLVFRASGFALEENESRDFVIGIDRNIFILEKEDGFRLNIICFSLKERGYEAMADNFREFQNSIENRFVIRKRIKNGTEYFRTNVFISEPLDLECDNERQLYVMRTQLIFGDFDYRFEERK